MFKYLLSFVLLTGCVSRPAPAPKPTPKPTAPVYEPHDVCNTLYEPHICMITIDSTTFAAHGSNKCKAMNKLKQTLVEHNHNPLIAEKAECGQVFE